MAAHDVGRLSRAAAACAGVAVAAYGIVALRTDTAFALRDPAAALAAAGLALLILVLPVLGPMVRITGYVLGGAAAAIGATALPRHPAAGVAILLSGLALALLDVRVGRRRAGASQYRVADPLVAGAAIVALVALVPRMFVRAFPDGGGPDSVMSAYLAGALLTLAAGVIMARPESGSLRTAAAAGPGTTIRRVTPALVAVPVIAALVGALTVRTGISRPVAAISTGAILAALAVLALVGYLIRSLEGADRRQRELVAELHDREEFASTLLQSMNEASEMERSNTQLRQANTRLETALAFKNDLTSMLTHDMAQPISSIASLSELLSTDWTDLPDDVRLELATKIDKNTRRLIKMMNDLQLLFRLDTGSVTARRTPVPVLEVVETVAAGFLDEHDVQVEIDEDVSALADRGHLAAVVQKLLNNAAAYGQGPIKVRAERGDDMVVLVVEDRGAGIPAELVPNLFGRFMRGAGLGLFIVRHLVEANGGAVRYEPAEPRGARLIVTLESASVAA